MKSQDQVKNVYLKKQKVRFVYFYHDLDLPFFYWLAHLAHTR